jgi:hypothetical protein
MTGYREARGPATPPYSLQDGLHITHRASREGWGVSQKRPRFRLCDARKNYATFTFGYTRSSGRPPEIGWFLGAGRERGLPPIRDSVAALGRQRTLRTCLALVPLKPRAASAALRAPEILLD